MELESSPNGFLLKVVVIKKTFYFSFQCFSRGTEDREHRNDHSYEIVVSTRDSVLLLIIMLG